MNLTYLRIYFFTSEFTLRSGQHSSKLTTTACEPKDQSIWSLWCNFLSVKDWYLRDIEANSFYKFLDLLLTGKTGHQEGQEGEFAFYHGNY